jgi:hypothetical protein
MIMSYVLSLIVAAAALGAAEASSEEIGLAVSARWVDDDGVTVGRCLDNPHDRDSTALIKEGESEIPEMIAIIERNREDRERHVVMDR